MAKYMDQEVFDGCAFVLVAASARDCMKDSVDSKAETVSKHFANSYSGLYRGDVFFEQQLAAAAAKIFSFVKRFSPVPKIQYRCAMAICSSHAAFNPDGTRKKRRFLNGAWFARSHPKPSSRVDACYANFMTHFVRVTSAGIVASDDVISDSS